VTVEPVNGHLKDRYGLRQFTRRGIGAAQAEAELAATTANLIKIWRHGAQSAHLVHAAPPPWPKAQQPLLRGQTVSNQRERRFGKINWVLTAPLFGDHGPYWFRALGKRLGLEVV
jgi:hypothetical protein